MSARSEIFARLKATLNPLHTAAERSAQAKQRIRDCAPNLIPLRGCAEGPARTALFETEALAAQADVRRLKGLQDVPEVVRAILAHAGIAALKAAPHSALQAMDWAGTDVTFGRGEGSDLAGLSFAYAGVAETGTLVMASGPHSPTTLNFLPDVHMVVIREDDIAANYEQVWTRFREHVQPGDPKMPRSVNWITGPSRTADIEQTLLLGAHGPRKLIILLIDGQTT